jgi:hypothetical protein
MGALALSEEIRAGMMADVAAARRRQWRIEAKLGRDSLWLFVRCGEGPAYAVRTAWSPGGGLIVDSSDWVGEAATVEARSALGMFEVRFGLADEEHMTAHATVTFTPSHALLLPFWPRDLYPLGPGGDPLSARGTVLAAQRGFNAPVVYFSTDAPDGLAMYFQNMTALNEYSKLTKTRPDGVVTGAWPELGYQPAVSTRAPAPAKHPLPRGRPVVLSDWILQAQEGMVDDEDEQGRLFVSWLSLCYRRTATGDVEFRDWPARAEQTLRNLSAVKAATQKFYGHRYVRPYLDGEPPDSMAQLAVLAPMIDYARWKGREPKLLGEMRGGLAKFWNAELALFDRYLPNVGGEKEVDKIDSWYVYHPLTKLGGLAKDGDRIARRLFFDALPYAIRVARKFDYNWPVFFHRRTLQVIQQSRKQDDGKPGEPGQSDVGGLYAYVMLQAWEMEGSKRYLDEAMKALRGLSGHGFEVEYQANLLAHGAVACLRCWQETGDRFFLTESYHLIASFFHNSIFWESGIDAAEHYSTLLGASCLHNGPYMAMYECWECCVLFADYLALGGDDIDAEVHYLLSEYCRRTLHRAWFYYPQELPEEVLCEKPRSGKIDRRFTFPLEDLYPAGDRPGTVGQEVYGCGAPWAFTVMGFKRPKGAGFLVVPETPLMMFEHAGEGEVRLKLAGRKGGASRLRIIADNKAAPDVALEAEGHALVPALVERGVEFRAPQRRDLVLRWPPGRRRRSSVRLPSGKR